MSIEINGFCDERFLAFRDAFIANFDEGLELGASLAVTYRGKTVVDLWAGYGNPEKTRLWEKDTIVPVFSTTKIMTAICALILIDRGLLDLDQTVAHYWPEFAQGGKEKVTIREALSHRAGVPGLAKPVPWAFQRDWAAITARLAAEPHWFDGRAQVCYHYATYGFVLGEVIRRVDGRRPAQFFREEIAEKSGADFEIALSSRSDAARVAGVRPWETRPLAGVEIGDRVRASFGPPFPAYDLWEFLSTENPAGIGLGNGRSIARVLAIVAMWGELDGVRYFSKEIADEAGSEQVYGQCPLLGAVRFGLGFGLDSKEFPAPSPASMHWGGAGGSWAFADPKAGVSLGYVPNNFENYVVRMDPRGARFKDVLQSVLPSL